MLILLLCLLLVLPTVDVKEDVKEDDDEEAEEDRVFFAGDMDRFATTTETSAVAVAVAVAMAVVDTEGNAMEADKDAVEEEGVMEEEEEEAAAEEEQEEEAGSSTEEKRGSSNNGDIVVRHCLTFFTCGTRNKTTRSNTDHSSGSWVMLGCNLGGNKRCTPGQRESKSVSALLGPRAVTRPCTSLSALMLVSACASITALASPAVVFATISTLERDEERDEDEDMHVERETGSVTEGNARRVSRFVDKYNTSLTLSRCAKLAYLGTEAFRRRSITGSLVSKRNGARNISVSATEGEDWKCSSSTRAGSDTKGRLS